MPRDASKVVGGNTRAILAKAPLVDPAVILPAARAAAVNPAILAPTVKAFQSAESKALDELRLRLITGAPQAARYLQELVDGVHEAAPHAVRLGAATAIIDRALDSIKVSPENKDLSEMTREELQAHASKFNHQLASLDAVDVEEVGNAAPLQPDPPIDPDPGAEQARQVPE